MLFLLLYGALASAAVVIENGVTIVTDPTVLFDAPTSNASLLLLDRTTAPNRMHADILQYNHLARQHRHHPPQLLHFYKTYTHSIRNVPAFLLQLPSRPTRWPALYVIQPTAAGTHATEMFSIPQLTRWLTAVAKVTPNTTVQPLLPPPPLHVISFPRSGQHLLASLIRSVAHRHDLYFSYCERHQSKNEHCPPESNMRKHHDFDLRFNVGTSQDAVVLLRTDRDRNLEALWRWECRVLRKCVSCEAAEAGQQHMQHVQYYEGFVDKWWRKGGSSSSSMQIDFHAFLEEPVHVVMHVLNRMYRDVAIDASVVVAVVNSHNIMERNTFGKVRRYTFLETRKGAPVKLGHPRWLNYYCGVCLN